MLVEGLKVAFPRTVLALHTDDYFRPPNEIPLRSNMHNWDDPRALHYGKMAKDLASLKAGQPVVIDTKNLNLNPGFLRTGQRIPVAFKPLPIIVIEGPLVLHFPKIRNLLDLSFYLDVPADLQIDKKLHRLPKNYEQSVLRPMYERYVSPSRIHADATLNLAKLSEKQALKKVTDLLVTRST